jgi:hypothetical protein
MLRVALTREDGLQDGHASPSRDVTDDLGELEMHLCEGRVHMLNMGRGVGQEPLPVPQRAAQHAPLGLGAKGTREPSGGMQAVQPLAIEPSSFRATGGPFRLAGSDQQDLQASGLQEHEQGQPVDPGRFHSDRGHATVEEPVGEGVEGGSERAKTADGWGGTIRWHRHPVLGFAAIDASSMGIAALERDEACWKGGRVGTGGDGSGK